MFLLSFKCNLIENLYLLVFAFCFNFLLKAILHFFTFYNATFCLIFIYSYAPAKHFELACVLPYIWTCLSFSHRTQMPKGTLWVRMRAWQSGVSVLRPWMRTCWNLTLSSPPCYLNKLFDCYMYNNLLFYCSLLTVWGFYCDKYILVIKG